MDGGESPETHVERDTAAVGTGATREGVLFDAAVATGDAAVPTRGAEPDLVFDGAPQYSDYVRLTHLQWENSVAANLRLDTATGLGEALIPDVPVTRYTNNEAMLWVGEVLAADYQAAAAAIAERVATNPESLSKVSTATEPQTFIAEVGRRFYRRPLTAAEVARYLALYQTGAGLALAGEEEFAAGVQLLLEVWMQAPRFLYRVEHSDGQLDGYEIATRLAYFLTDTTPTDALLEAAEAGTLDTVEGVVNAAHELLATPQAALVFRRFHDETYTLRRLATVEFDDSAASSNLGASLGQAAHLFFDRQFREGLGLRELLLSQVAFVNAELAPLYAIAAPEAGGFEAVTLNESRRGMFAQLPFLMVDSVNADPNAFRRGAMFTNYVLCRKLTQTADLGPVPPPPTEGLTNRERSSQLVAGEACQECHHLIDPFGFAFENFDGYGRERSEDNGSPVDTTGVYPFASNPAFADSAELMAILAESQLAHGCYAKQLTEFSLGRSLTTADAALVEQLQDLSIDRNESLAGLVTVIVSSETFRSSGEPQ